MYTKVELKHIYNKSNKILATLNRANIFCNSVVYTEQNEEELNSAKTFIETKIDIISDIKSLISTYFKNPSTSNLEELSEKIKSLIAQYRELSKDPYLSRLEHIYGHYVTECELTI